MSDSTNKSNAIVVETKIIPNCTAVRSIWRKRIGSISIFHSCSLALAQLSRKQASGTSGFRNNPCLQGLLALDQADIQVIAEVRPEFPQLPALRTLHLYSTPETRSISAKLKL